MISSQPKNASNSQAPNLQKVTGGDEGTTDTKKSTEKWPEMMPSETLRKVFDKKYSEYLYIHELYRVEGRQPSAVWYYYFCDTLQLLVYWLRIQLIEGWYLHLIRFYPAWYIPYRSYTEILARRYN